MSTSVVEALGMSRAGLLLRFKGPVAASTTPGDCKALLVALSGGLERKTGRPTEDSRFSLGGRPRFTAFASGTIELILDVDIDDDALMRTNYQRRSPVMAVNIVRNSLLADPKIVVIELELGMMTQASGLEVYCPNALALADTEDRVLKEAHDAEVSILS